MKKKPSKAQLPSPLELAKLAAILRPQAEPAAALKVAMKFYVEAVYFRGKWAGKCLDGLITKFGSGDLQFVRTRELESEPLIKEAEARWADTLELDPRKADDPVRQHLAQHGSRLKTARSVLDNFLRYYNSLSGVATLDRLLSLKFFIAKLDHAIKSKKIRGIPKFLLDHVIEHALARRRESQRKSARKTRQQKSLVNIAQ